MLNYLILEPIRHRYFGLGWLRFWQILHDRTNGAMDDAYRALVRLWRPPIALPDPALLDRGQIAILVGELRRDGCALLPYRVSKQDIDALRGFAFATPAYADNRAKTALLREDSVAAGHARYTWRTGDLLANPVIQRLVLEGPFNAIAQDYLGSRPKLATITLWLNPAFPGRNENNVYHCDNDGPGFLKFFIYLTDMRIGTGAHYFIKGTHSHRKPSQFSRVSRYSEEQLFAHYDQAIEYVAEGEAGTILAEDTIGFHRGSNIERGYRLMLQLQYSVIDIPTEEDVAREYAPFAVPGLDPATARVTGKFFKAW